MNEPTKPKNPFREIVQPFIDLVHAPRVLWGLNLNYCIEGFVYFGMVIYLAMYFNTYVGLDDQRAGWMVGVLTSGITISMFFVGGRADRWGVRPTLLAAISLMIVGRAILAAAPVSGLPGGAVLSGMNGVALGGIVFVVLGYGLYQPAAYKAVRDFSTPETANMGYAMLYGVMNLGAWLPSFMSPVRERWGIQGSYVFYTLSSVAGLAMLAMILNRKTVDAAIARAKAGEPKKPEAPASAPAPATVSARILRWLREHPIADPKFAFFIFCLMPVQTLFAHNWLTLPLYVNRAFSGSWVGDRFETATNLNALLVFVLCPIVAALTTKTRVYSMMIVGTAVMAVPTFLLALGPTVWGLFTFIVVMTIGEAIWQPRFLQYAAEIAPEGRTGAYMGVAQFPWFLTKTIVPLYSGWFLSRYCPDPATGKPLDTQTMWLIYGIIAMSSTVMLILGRGWVGRNFKSKAD